MAGVFVVRTLDDCLGLRAELDKEPSRVIVIGAGFIGAEVAATCRARGLEVTILEMAEVPLERALGRVPEHKVVSDGRLVVQSNNEGVPFVLASPTAAISQDIIRTANELLNAGRMAAFAGRS